VLGALFWYYVARWLGEDRLKSWTRRWGRWITLGPKDVDRADDWFDRYGGWVVFFGRVIPTVRTLVAIPAGLFGMSLGLYLLLTTLGSAIWTAALALLGWWLGSNWKDVGTYIDPLTYAVMAAIIVIYIYRVITFDGSEAGAETGDAGPR
jgi:membrane protein DedA with SNARE-associated domain